MDDLKKYHQAVKTFRANRAKALPVLLEMAAQESPAARKARKFLKSYGIDAVPPLA